MKKTYKKPAIIARTIQLDSILAGSLGMGGTEGDGVAESKGASFFDDADDNEPYWPTMK